MQRKQKKPEKKPGQKQPGQKRLKQKQLLERFRAFALGITRRDRVVVLFHPDTDGLCSALIVSHAVEKLRGRKAERAFFQPRGEIALSEETLRMLRDKKFTKLVVVDLAVDENPAAVRRAAEFLHVLVVDHHELRHDLNSQKIVFIKPQMLGDRKPASYPASKLCFSLFRRVADIDSVMWVAAAGVLGDNAQRRWKGFIASAARRNRVKVSELRGLEELITGVESMEPRMLGRLFLALQGVKKPAALRNAKFYAKFCALKKTLDSEIAGIEKRFRKGREDFPKLGLVYFMFRSRHNLKSALINRLSNESPHTTFVLVQDLGKPEISFSARRQDFRVKVNELLEDAVKGFEGASAGGHIPAAAGKIKRKDLGRFRERLVSLHPPAGRRGRE